VNTNNSYRWRNQVLWGLLIAGIGVALLLDQMDVLYFEHLWHYWPLVLVLAGLNKVIGYPSVRDFTSGLWAMFIGVWLFANFEHIAGLDFQNSWPYVVIFAGVTMVLKPFIGARFAANPPAREFRHED
jgi:hypothetical protein